MRLALILIILILIAGCGSDDVGVNETNTTQQPVEVVTEEQEDVIEEENAEVKEPGIKKTEPEETEPEETEPKETEPEEPQREELLEEVVKRPPRTYFEEFNITTKRYGFYHNGVLSPTLYAKVGDTVRINLQHQGGVHDIVVPHFRVSSERITLDNPSASVEFYVNETGNFSFYCGVIGHQDTDNGWLIVTP
jgi:hypothetical protein